MVAEILAERRRYVSENALDSLAFAERTPAVATSLCPGSNTSRIAHRLGDFRCLRHSPDLCAFNNRFSARAQTRDHASAHGSSSRGMKNEVRGSMQRESL